MQFIISVSKPQQLMYSLLLVKAFVKCLVHRFINNAQQN